ncbi:MAG: hypothetical protein KatS3mg068_1984 [Candidatus Sericytochromatia bacterium]|nr:MAG: hypothetical protein KatS3mg068_1984 [Candidatus Sericytochromatia bacterium]
MSSISSNRVMTNVPVDNVKSTESIQGKENQAEVKRKAPSVQFKKDSVSTNNVSSASSTLKNLFSNVFSRFSRTPNQNRVNEFSSLKNDILKYINKDIKEGGSLKFALGEKNKLGFISNKKEVSQFRKHAEKEFSTENIDFVKSAKDLVKIKDTEKFKEKFKELCKTFIERNSSKEVNLPGSCKREMLSALEKADVKEMAKSLREALPQIIKNLDDTKYRFDTTRIKL